MMRSQLEQIIFGSALAESLTADSRYHRRFLIRETLGDKLRDHGQFAEQHNQTNIFQAFSLPGRSEILDPSPGDDLEWLAFSALSAIEGDLFKVWKSLADSREKIRARTGTQIALKNLSAGNYEFSGYDNPQYFDDICLIRAIGIALVHRKNFNGMLKVIQEDIGFTHALDGIWAAESIAALTNNLLSGITRSDAIAEAIEMVPAGSWTAHTFEIAMAVAKSTNNLWDRVIALEQKIVNPVNSHANSAPETLACLLVHARYSANIQEFLFSGFLHSRYSDSMPALAGALASVIFNEDWVPKAYISPSKQLDGVCLPQFKNYPLSHLVREIEDFWQS